MKSIRSIAMAAGLLAMSSILAAQPPPARRADRPAVTTQQAAQAEAKFEEGRKLFFQRQYDKAIVLLRDAARMNPEKTGYRLLLAKAQRRAGKRDTAVDLLKAILKANPEHVEAGIELAEMYSPKEADRVIEILKPLLKFKHDYPLYHMLAEAYYQKENWDEARKHYEEAVRLNPSSPEDAYQLGNIYLAQKRFARAVSSYEKAGELGIDTAAYHYKLASAYFNLRNYLGKVTTAQVLGGKVGQIKNDLLLIDRAPGKKDTFYVAGAKSAVFQIAKAQQMGIDTPQIRFLEANIWLSARRYAKADALYKALDGKLDKTDQGLFWFYWAQTALGLDDYDSYLSRLGKAIEAEPEVYKATLADAYVTVARRFHQKGRHGKYIEFLAKAVQTNPLSAKLHLTLGDAYWQAKKRPEAIEHYKLVLELEPDHPERVRLLNRIRSAAETPATAPVTVQR
ncbi:MAG TPA: tetratricopeptide repeat protein [Phycisphaerae bacterium]|nr:tetratricopeptide repeat protein [Phycisphaerae bacterium]